MAILAKFYVELAKETAAKFEIRSLPALLVLRIDNLARDVSV